MTTVTSPPPGGYEAKILSGASITPSVPVYGKLSGIIIPATWTSAAITFQGSQDGTTFYDIWDEAQTATAVERTIVSGNVPASGGRFLALDLVDWIGIKFVKVRSGTSAAPVNQGADRTLVLTTSG